MSKQESTGLLKSSANVVFMAEALCHRHPGVFWPMKLNLEAHGVSVRLVKNTQNIWVRDYFPVQVNGEFFRFRYQRDRKYPQLSVDSEPWSGLVCPVKESKIVLDGGNIVTGHGKAILTEKVVKQNGEDVVGKLEKLLGVEIIIIPGEPGDSLGHSDGLCKFLDDKTVLVNDYSSIFSKDGRFIEYSNALIRSLQDAGLAVEIMPYAYGDWPWEMSEKHFRELFPDADEFNPGFGYYINYLESDGVVLMPAMRLKKDAQALSILKKWHPKSDIVAIDCTKLSMEGGLLHCVTASYHYE